MTQEQNERDMQELKLAQEANLSAQELSTRTGIERLRLDTQRQLFNAEALIKAREGSGI
jgi:hypothetical protein